MASSAAAVEPVGNSDASANGAAVELRDRLRSADPGSASRAVGDMDTGMAVRPTPSNAPAVKVDLASDKPQRGDTIEYPIHGPDKFASTIAHYAKLEHQAEMEAEDAEARAAQMEQVVADTPDFAEAEPEVRAEPEVVVVENDQPDMPDMPATSGEAAGDDGMSVMTTDADQRGTEFA